GSRKSVVGMYPMISPAFGAAEPFGAESADMATADWAIHASGAALRSDAAEKGIPRSKTRTQKRDKSPARMIRLLVTGEAGSEDGGLPDPFSMAKPAHRVKTEAGVKLS